MRGRLDLHDYRASCSLSPTPYAIQLVDLAYPCSGWFPVPTSRRRSVQGAGRRQRRNTHTRLPPALVSRLPRHEPPRQRAHPRPGSSAGRHRQSPASPDRTRHPGTAGQKDQPRRGRTPTPLASPPGSPTPKACASASKPHNRTSSRSGKAGGRESSAGTAGCGAGGAGRGAGGGCCAREPVRPAPVTAVVKGAGGTVP